MTMESTKTSSNMAEYALESQKGSVSMKLQTERGIITISSDVFTNLTIKIRAACWRPLFFETEALPMALKHRPFTEADAKEVADWQYSLPEPGFPR